MTEYAYQHIPGPTERSRQRRSSSNSSSVEILGVVDNTNKVPLSDKPVTGEANHSTGFLRLLASSGRTPLLLAFADLVGLMLPAVAAEHGRFWLACMAGATVLLCQSAGLYRPRLHLSVLDEVPAMAARSAAAATCVAGVIFVTAHGSVLGSFAGLAIAGTFCQILTRGLAYQTIRIARQRGLAAHSTVILGGGMIGTKLADTLQADKSYGLNVTGFIDDDPLVPGPSSRSDHHHLGNVDDLPLILTNETISVLIVAFASVPESELVNVVRATEARGCEVFIVPRLYEVHTQGGHPDHIGAIPVVRLLRHRFDSAAWITKRIFDVFFSVIALILLSPIFAIAALAVRLEGGPGVLFRQIRVGMHGHHFEVLKFRTLKPANEDESAKNWNVSKDARLGRVGRFLRATSIDELPQLWNVLRGEMTLVGPRPERPYFVELFSAEHPRYLHRHRVPVGLTGLAQVNGLRGNTSIADRARYDNYYIENWSLWLDVKILLRTVREVVGARGG